MRTTTKTAIACLAAAGALACALTFGGKFIASSDKTAVPLSSPRSAESGRSPSGSAKKTDSRKSPDVGKPSEWSELKSIMAEMDGETRAKLLQEYLGKLDSAGLKKATEFLASLGNDSIEHVDRSLDLWAQVDPDAALSWATKKYPAKVGALLSGWAFKDPDAAIAWADSEGKTKSGGNSYYGFIVDGFKERPDRLEKGTALLRSLSPEDAKSSEMVKVLRDFFGSKNTGPEETKAWVDSLPSEAKAEASTYMVAQVTMQDIKLGLDMFQNSRASSLYLGVLFTEAIGQGKQSDIEQYISAMPPGESRSIFEGVFDKATQGKK